MILRYKKALSGHEKEELGPTKIQLYLSTNSPHQKLYKSLKYPTTKKKRKGILKKDRQRRRDRIYWGYKIEISSFKRDHYLGLSEDIWPWINDSFMEAKVRAIFFTSFLQTIILYTVVNLFCCQTIGLEELFHTLLWDDTVY